MPDRWFLGTTSTQQTAMAFVSKLSASIFLGIRTDHEAHDSSVACLVIHHAH